MDTSLLDRAVEEKLVTLTDVTWEQFKGIEAQLIDNRSVRLSYLSGILEIMAPIGEEHESVKSSFSLLLDAYLKAKKIRFYKRGGYTLQAPGYASGTPDESYSIGTKKQVPDIVIEIIVTSGTIDRRQLYKPKRIPEVWFWKSDIIRIFYLNEQGEYEEVERSSFFPDLDPNILLPYIAMRDQYDAILEFEQFLREQLLD